MHALKSHFQKAELWSLAHSFLGFLAAELSVSAAFPVQEVLGGNFSEQALMAVAFAVARSVVKALLNLFVSFFPKKEVA